LHMSLLLAAALASAAVPGTDETPICINWKEKPTVLTPRRECYTKARWRQVLAARARDGRMTDRPWGNNSFQSEAGFEFARITSDRAARR
jgi:hypothetical protein